MATVGGDAVVVDAVVVDAAVVAARPRMIHRRSSYSLNRSGKSFSASCSSPDFGVLSQQSVLVFAKY